MKLQILLCLGLALFYSQAAPPELSGILPLSTTEPKDFDFCSAVNTIIRRLKRNPLDLSFPNIHANLTVTEDIYLNFDVTNITFWGLDRVELVNCSQWDVNNTISETFCSVFLDKFNIYLTDYTLAGEAGGLPLEGNGDGSIKMENFTISLAGIYPTEPLRNLQFDSLMLDFFLYQWTVFLEGLMPGNDIGTVTNEVLSEVGRESMNAIEDAINVHLTDIVNELLPNLSDENDLYKLIGGGGLFE